MYIHVQYRSHSTGHTDLIRERRVRAILLVSSIREIALNCSTELPVLEGKSSAQHNSPDGGMLLRLHVGFTLSLASLHECVVYVCIYVTVYAKGAISRQNRI